jgi:hypothetical protein
MIPLMRCPIGTTLAIAATGALVSGCGGSKSASAEAKPAKTVPLTRGQAIAFANAVNLRAADLPGWRIPTPASEPRPLTDSRHTAFARCAGTRPFRYLARLSSAAFVQGTDSAGAEMVSNVAVAPSPSLAASEYAALATARGRSCFTRLSRAENSEDIRLNSEGFSWSSLPLPEAAHGFKVRLAGTVGSSGPGGEGTHLYFDLLAFTSGPAQVVLYASAWPSPPQPSTERHLLSVLYSRAKAHSL